MSRLETAPNLSAPDAFYEELIDAHRGLTDEQSMALNARLVLLLANHVGDLEVLREALDLARVDAHQGSEPERPDDTKRHEE
jgi:hypothetical protein